MSWDWSFAIHILPSLLDGLRVTVEITLVASMLALLLGLLFAIMRLSPVAPVRRVVYAVTEVIRRTPLLVQLYVLFESGGAKTGHGSGGIVRPRAE